MLSFLGRRRGFAIALLAAAAALFGCCACFLLATRTMTRQLRRLRRTTVYQEFYRHEIFDQIDERVFYRLLRCLS